MGQVLSLPSRIFHHTWTFYTGFWHYWAGAGRYSSYHPWRNIIVNTDKGKEPKPYTTTASLKPRPEDSEETQLFKQNARIHLFSLASNFYLWNKPHYRKPSYQQDLLDNLRNVAVPGTGIPLSWWTRSSLLAWGYILTAYPVTCFIAAIHEWIRTKGKVSISQEYGTRLLAPDDWFNYWRLNCNVVALHSLLNDMPSDYDMENKWTFLEEGVKRNVPVSPFLRCPALVIKHRNEEGGLGIFFYKNAVVGGDWIIQEKIANSDWVANLLPPNAPLSTFRVITCSRAGFDATAQSATDSVRALSCVFRAGRAGASTDHDSVLFDVDVHTGIVGEGTTNAHWYRLGFRQMWPGQCPWRSPHCYRTHPDGDISVTGACVPNIAEMLQLVEQSHWKMCPQVPFAGWDVVLSADPNLPVCLLEVNLSCNFFRGSFDRKVRAKEERI